MSISVRVCVLLVSDWFFEVSIHGLPISWAHLYLDLNDSANEVIANESFVDCFLRVSSHLSCCR